MYVHREAWVDLRVDAVCEACGSNFSYTHEIRETGGKWSDPQAKVQERLMQGEAGVKRCPNCKYLQSWMQSLWSEEWQVLFVLLTGVPSIAIVAYFFGWPDSLGWEDGLWNALPVAGYIFLFWLTIWPGIFFARKFIKPNKLWYKRHGFHLFLPNQPTITAGDWVLREGVVSTQRCKKSVEQRLEEQKKPVQHELLPSHISSESQPEKKTEKDTNIFEILTDAVCCVMCADKKVTTRERKAIHKILEKTKAPWDGNKIEEHINNFVQRVKKDGLKSIVQEICDKLPEFKKRGKELVLLRCIDYMTRADGIIDENEKQLTEKFKSALGIKYSDYAGSATQVETTTSREKEETEQEKQVTANHGSQDNVKINESSAVSRKESNSVEEYTVTISGKGWASGLWAERPIQVPGNVNVAFFLSQQPLPPVWPEDEEYRSYIMGDQQRLQNHWITVLLHHPNKDVVIQTLRLPHIECVGSIPVSIADFLVQDDVSIAEEAARTVWRLSDYGVHKIFNVILSRGLTPSDYSASQVAKAVKFLENKCPPERRQLLEKEVHDDFK